MLLYAAPSPDVETVSVVMARQAVSQALNNKVVVDAVRKQVRGSSASCCSGGSGRGYIVDTNDARPCPKTACVMLVLYMVVHTWCLV